MKKKLYRVYNAFRNALYKNRVILRIYAFFRSDIPDKKASRKLKKYGYQDLTLLSKTLKEENIKCFCDFGTLLGIIREGAFIPHDNDIDTGILKDEFFSWEKLESVLGKLGMKKKYYYTYQGEVTEQTYLFPDGISVDFFLYENIDEKNMRTYVYYKNHDMIYENAHVRSVKALIYPRIDGLKEIDFNNCTAMIPNNAERRLEDIYGKGWKVPEPGYQPDRKQNIMPELGEKHVV